MNKTFVNTYKFSFAETANSFIYSLKKLPLIGKKIPDSIYRETNGKLIIGIISAVLNFLWGFLKKAIYMGLMVILPAKFIVRNNGDFVSTSLHIFFFLSFVIGPLNNLSVTEHPKDAFNMIRLMKVQPKEYFVSGCIYKRLMCFVNFIPIIVIIFSPIKGMILLLEFIAMRFLGEAIELFIFDKTNCLLATKNWFAISLVIINLIAAYLLPYIGITIGFGKFFYSGTGLIFIMILGLLSFIYTIKYNSYHDIGNLIITKNALFKDDVVSSDITFGDVKINEKNIKQEDLKSDKYKDKEGYEYLNAIFFNRHRKLLLGTAKFYVIIIAVITIVVMGVIFIKPEINELVLKTIYSTASFWVFIMYIMSTSKRICKAMFYNCDVSLLRYGYYRDPKIILSNFTIRVKKVIAINLMPALAICILLSSLMISSGYGGDMASIIPMMLSILCLSCFFSIHNLFLYYIIQPYTAQLEVKSILFSIINTLTYGICYMCLQLDATTYIFSLGIIIVTVIYVAIALSAIYRFAPKTFRLR